MTNETQNKNSSPQLIKSLHERLSELSEPQKLVIQLRFWEDLSIEQIAFIMNKTWDEVDQIIEITLDKLRGQLVEFRYQKNCAA